MDGFTVGKANRFLDSSTRSSGLDSKSMQIGGMNSTTTEKSSSVQKSFADTLNEAIGSVNQMQVAADKGMQDLATGRTDNIADVMIATEKADIALKLMVQVRNKIIDAYQEVMKMQV
jgi:flagellar hook-basal body complex protein FliE